MSDHIRENHGALAAAERRLLIWMARRLPRAIHSDHLTMLALAAMGLAGTGFALARFDRHALWLVVVSLFLNWVGDSLDGTLARVRGHERPRYGFYVDHVLDIIGTTLLVAGLACSGFMHPVIALALLAAYLMVAGEVFLATAVKQAFRMSFAGFGPTELRIVLAVGAIALFDDPRVRVPGIGSLQLFDLGGIIAAVGLAIALVAAVARNTRALARAEPRVWNVQPERTCSLTISPTLTP